MPKLNKAKAKKTEAAEGSGFDPLPDGAYHLRLRDVDASKPDGPAGPYWVWEFEVVEDGEWKKRRLWNNTSLSDAAAFKMAETFKAFGVPADTDTDELLGQVVLGIVSQRTIQKGARKGELTNQIDRLKPADPEFELPEGLDDDEGTKGESPDPEDLF